MITGHNGSFISGFARYIGTQTSVFAEAFVVLEGLELVVPLHLTSIWIEHDSQVLVDNLNESAAIPWSIIYIFSCIKHILQGIRYKVTHIFREGNNVADLFANWALDNVDSRIFNCFQDLPRAVHGLLQMDKQEIPRLRQHKGKKHIVKVFVSLCFGMLRIPKHFGYKKLT